MTSNIKSQDSTQRNAAHMTANQTTPSVVVLSVQQRYTITKPHAHTQTPRVKRTPGRVSQVTLHALQFQAVC